MSLTLKEVYAKVNAQPDPKVGYVFDNPIHYVVLNNGDGTLDMDIIAKFDKIYEKIEQTEGPGVVVTIGSGAKIFGAGFNLPMWGAAVANPI